MRVSVARKIRRLLRKYGYLHNPRAINGGLCVEFAEDLCFSLPRSAEYLEAGPDPDYAFRTQRVMHAFVSYKGKFYDSETPQGVATWKELPIFKRYK